MKPADFRRQVFRTPPQWTYTLSVGLDRQEAGGFSLFSRPGFAGWALDADAARGVASVAVDGCGRIYWIHRFIHDMFRWDPAARISEPTVALDDGEGASGARFGRLIATADRLWVLDRAGARVLALRPDTFQIVTEIPLDSPIDIGFGAGRLVALQANAIASYDAGGRLVASGGRDHLSAAIALAVDPRGQAIYVVDAGLRRFLRFDWTGAFRDEVGSFDVVSPEFVPRLLAVDPAGSLFASDGGPVVHEFSADGGYVGSTGEVSTISSVLAMTFDPAGDLYVAAPAGIARFTRGAGVAGNAGVFYSRTLDNGSTTGELWHRLDLTADLAEGGTIDVSYATSDDPTLVDAIAGIFDRDAGAAERASALEAMLGDRWQGPREFTSPGRTYSMLFGAAAKRYLWLKVALSAQSPKATAIVREMRVCYPRISYLRYLPAVYQEDPASREFLERFLAMFETVFGDLEATIERLPEFLDPGSTPPGFLDWLAQWLDLGVEEEWSAAIKRRLILNAGRLYETKGTPAGLADFIEIVTGRRPLVRESFQTERPEIVGNALRLGASRLSATPTERVPRDQRTILDGTSALGASRLRSTLYRAVDPFVAAANTFTLVMPMSARQFERQRRALTRIVNEHAPAHAVCELRIRPAAGAVVGADLTLENPRPLHLGYSSLGRAICVSRLRYGPELGIDATLDVNGDR
jgi:phage tail-like protein